MEIDKVATEPRKKNRMHAWYTVYALHTEDETWHLYTYIYTFYTEKVNSQCDPQEWHITVGWCDKYTNNTSLFISSFLKVLHVNNQHRKYKYKYIFSIKGPLGKI